VITKHGNSLARRTQSLAQTERGRFAFSRATGPQSVTAGTILAERKELMNQDDRVLGRKGARILTPGEIDYVTGTFLIHTNTACTFAALSGSPLPDGDRAECHV
jgi:hypothetical protein